jgi:hypothetical protein
LPFYPFSVAPGHLFLLPFYCFTVLPSLLITSAFYRFTVLPFTGALPHRTTRKQKTYTTPAQAAEKVNKSNQMQKMRILLEECGSRTKSLSQLTENESLYPNRPENKQTSTSWRWRRTCELKLRLAQFTLDQS